MSLSTWLRIDPGQFAALTKSFTGTGDFVLMWNSEESGPCSFHVSEPREYTIGALPTAEIRIPDSAVSRIHAVISGHPGKWSFEDKDSTNGTRVVYDLKGPDSLELRPGQQLALIGGELLYISPNVRAGIYATIGLVDGTPRIPWGSNAQAFSLDSLTPRQRHALWLLARPIRVGSSGEPATSSEMAPEMMCTPGNVDAILSRVAQAWKVEGRPGEIRRKLARIALELDVRR